MRSQLIPAVIALLLAAPTLRAQPGGAQSPRPIYRMAPAEVGSLIAEMRQAHPDLPDRVVAIARRNIGQPYEIYLLGESPFESIDGQPVYCLDRSDCVVFTEHTLAMALSRDWPQFLAVLQRIRYRNGEIGVRTRNHYTEADWNRNNRWLATDVTEALAGPAAARFSQDVDRAKFFRERYKLDEAIPRETIDEAYVPFEQIDAVRSSLRNGDIVNFVSGNGQKRWVGHVGLVAIGSDGAVNLIHSAKPAVREESIDAYIARATADREARLAEGKSTFAGFKFLRLTADPWTELAKIDGDAAPRVVVPKDSPVSWDEFIKTTTIPPAEPVAPVPPAE